MNAEIKKIESYLLARWLTSMPLRLNPSLHREHLNGNLCQFTAASLSNSGLVAATLGTVDLVAVMLEFAAVGILLATGFSSPADFLTLRIKQDF